MKVLIVLTVVALVTCDKFEKAEIMKAQNQLIDESVAQLKKMGEDNKATAPFKMVGMVNDNVGQIAAMMMAEADRREKEGLPVVKTVFTDIRDNIMEKGRKGALYEDLPSYTLKNKTDGIVGLAKFVVTTKVILWRCQLDQERRTVHPTPQLNEKDAWAAWAYQCNKVLSVLHEVIAKLHADKSEYWAHNHELMLGYIENGIPKIIEWIKAEPDSAKRTKYLNIFVEDLNLLNTVADSRA